MKYPVAILTVLLSLQTVLLFTPNGMAQGQVYSHLKARTLAEELGMGTRMAATLMLNGGFPDKWSMVAGGDEAPGYLQWPIPERRLGRGFGSDGGRHEAIDITAPTGTPVHVMAPGIVAYADDGVKGYGNLVMVVHPGGWVTLYAHLDRFKSEPGQLVARGDVIGTVGSTGISRGPHLHFALILRGVAKDPMKFMRGAPGQEMMLSMADTTLR